MSADLYKWVWGFLDVNDFIPFCLAWVSNKSVPASSLARGAVLVTVLAFVDWEKFSYNRAKRLEIREVGLPAIEHFVAAFVARVCLGWQPVDDVDCTRYGERPVRVGKVGGVEECPCHVLDDLDSRLGMWVLLA